MDREILFRGKDIYGKWLYGDLINLTNELKQICNHTQLEHAHSVDIKTIGQYTGLTDKNGTKIFEGDIVNFRTGYYQFKNLIISFDEQTARFVCKNKKCGKMPLDSKWSYEVIGNIHDNSDLLEVSE